MIRSKNIDWYRHLSFAAVGGFFAAYAVLLRMGVMANAQTLNLLELLISILRCNRLTALMHVGALALYVLGTMSTVVLPHLFGWDMRRVCPLIDALCAVVLVFLPVDMPVMLSLYPIFFAMSVQWSSFTGAQDHISSTIFPPTTPSRRPCRWRGTCVSAKKASFGGCGSISPPSSASMWAPP